MYHSVFAQRLRVLGSAAFFSLVTAPALALFVAFIGLSFSQSLSGQFLATAHALIDGAPAGMVNTTVCELATTLDGGEVKSLPEAVLPLCQNAVTGEGAWQHDVDREVRSLYLLVSFIGLGVWLALNPVSLLWRSLFRRKTS